MTLQVPDRDSNMVSVVLFLPVSEEKYTQTHTHIPTLTHYVYGYLYRSIYIQEANADEFEDKEWTFVIEGVSISYSLTGCSHEY